MNTANSQAVNANIRFALELPSRQRSLRDLHSGQAFASLVAENPPQFYENRFAIKFTYSWRP